MTKLSIKQGVLIAAILFVVIATLVFFMATELQPSSPIIIKISTGETGPGEIQYTRVSVINNSDRTFTNVVVDMGHAGSEMIETLAPRQTYIASPNSLEGVSEIKVSTDQGVVITKNLK